MKKNKIKKIEFILVVAIFQILLLINLCVAHSYILHQTDSLIRNSKVIGEKNKFKNLIGKGINLLIGFLSIKQIGSVSAEIWDCCPETGQEISSGEDCDDGDTPIPGKCEYGCCIDSHEGLCTTRSIEQTCKEDGGEWNKDESCSIQECQRGCCVLGSQTAFVIDSRCSLLSSIYGFEKNFQQQIKTELECLGFAESLIMGACILEGGGCRFVTETECKNKLWGKFFPGLLCSADELETNCKRQSFISCVEERDEIYWFDSCGNRENIYSSNRDASWNNGKILSKSESCGAGLSNAGSTSCGNCDYFLGSKCSETKTGETHVADGNYVCENMNCGDGKNNGQSWCEYEGYIGDGKDTVGSEHWKGICIEGEIKYENCGDYRTGLCSEGEGMASCIVNEASECLTYNPIQELEKGEEDEKDEMVDIQENVDKCEKNKHCMSKEVNLIRDGEDGENDFFAFKMCVPKYPKGGNLKDEYDDNLCSMANQECKVYYEKGILGEWECTANCECETEKFAQQMNDFCISLGDCGSYINYKGEGSNNVKIKGEKGFELDSDGKEEDGKDGRDYEESKGAGKAPGVCISYSPDITIPLPNGKEITIPGQCKESIYLWENYKGKENSVADQKVEPNIEKFLASIGKFEMAGGEMSDETANKLFKYIGGISGAGAIVTAALSGGDLLLLTSPINILGPVGAGFATAFTAVGLGSLGGWVLTKLLGIGGDAATVIIISGGTTGLLIALGKLTALSPTFGWISLGIAILITLLSWITGWGDVETRIVKFECLPWQAPLGGDDCEACNGDKLKPCTKYRCESLGKWCELINENTENPICISMPSDNNAPIISPGNLLTEGYKFQNSGNKRVEIRKDNGECIQEFTSVSFNLKTDEYAQCKWSLTQPTSPSYNEMVDSRNSHAYTTTHSFTIEEMPSVHSLDPSEITGNLKEWYGNMNMYVKCQDGQKPPKYNTDEYVVNFCINSGPDVTVVDHSQTVTEPKNNAFLKYNATESDFKIWVNEPAECSYSVVGNQNYDAMTPMTCEIELEDKELNGWPCSTILTNLSNGENKFYIKCKDKPWVTEENIGEYKERNVNQDDFVYTLHVSESELKIDSIRFEALGHFVGSGETITIGGMEYTSVEMEVKTSGGAEDGKAICFWGVLEKQDLFEDTFSEIHKQRFSPRFSGTYNNYIECEDKAENIVNSIAQFTINLDSSPPNVARAYSEGNKLVILTNEEAECYYDFNRCNFDINNATSMTTAFSTTHTANLAVGKTYHIKCNDIWGNRNDECAIKIESTVV